MTSYRNENMWTTSIKRPNDYYAKSTVRGVSNLAGRAGYSRAKMEEGSSSNLSSNKRVYPKEDIPKEDSIQRVNILNDKQNTSHYGYHYSHLNDKPKQKEDLIKEQKRQQMEKAKLMDQIDQSKRNFMQKQRLKHFEMEPKRLKEPTLEDIKIKQTSTVKMPSIKQIPYNLTSKKSMLVGLNNIGNTCYMNSTLQCLLHIPQFNDYFLNSTFKSDLKFNGKVADAYGKLVNTMYSSNNKSETPSQLKQSLGVRFHQFSGYSQEDAQELLVSLRESINNDVSRVDKKKAKYKQLTADTKKHTLAQISEQWWNYYKERDDSIIQDFFSGQLMSKVICSRCKNESIAFDNFEDLTLSFGRYQTSAQLVKMIQLFLGEQTLSDDFFCSKCKQLRESTKKLAIFRLPKVLVIQLKRFSYGKWRKQKINTKINFPNQLDLSYFINESKHQTVQNPKYQLIGVVNHSGGIDFGHYTADCRDISNGRWYNFNDSSVSDSSYNGNQKFCSSSPYLLFYFKK